MTGHQDRGVAPTTAVSLRDGTGRTGRARTATGARRSRRRAPFVGAVLLPVVLLAGCATPLPQAAPEPAPAVPPPAVTVAQAQRVLDAVAEVVAAGDEANDAAGLGARLDGPALATRTAEYVRNTVTEGAKAPTALPFEEQALIVPETDTWPRTQLVVTEQPADLQAPRVLVLRQSAPREPYKLWGWARLLPSTQMPATAAPEVGSETLAPDSDALLVTPTDALAQYADVLTNGDGSPFAASFAPDAFRTAVEASRAGLVGQLTDVATLAETYTPAAEPVVTLATVDGGAIVVGDLTTTATMTVAVEGGKLKIDALASALAGGATEAGTYATTYTGVVVLYVPPAGSDAQVQVLAGEQVVTGASVQ